MNKKLLELYVGERIANQDARGLIAAISMTRKELRTEMVRYRKIVKGRVEKTKAEGDILLAEIEGD